MAKNFLQKKSDLKIFKPDFQNEIGKNLIEFGEESFGLSGDAAAQKNQSDQIWKRHQSVENIGDSPDRIHGEIGTDEDGGHIKPTVSEFFPMALADQKLQALFGIVRPA